MRFGPGFTPTYCVASRRCTTSTRFQRERCAHGVFGMPYGTQPETEEWRAAVYRFSRFMNWTTPERFMLVNEIRREQPNMGNPIFSFMGVPITEDSASKLNEAMKKCGVSALEVAGVCERFCKNRPPRSTNCRTGTKRRSTMTEQEICDDGRRGGGKGGCRCRSGAILGKEIQESVEAAVTDAARLGAEASIKAVEQERKKFRDGRSDRRFRNTSSCCGTIPCSTPTAPTQYTTRPAQPPERRERRGNRGGTGRAARGEFQGRKHYEVGSPDATYHAPCEQDARNLQGRLRKQRRRGRAEALPRHRSPLS